MLYREDRFEQVCRELGCRFEWESDEEIDVTLPRGKSFTDSNRKLFNIWVIADDDAAVADFRDYLKLFI